MTLITRIMRSLLPHAPPPRRLRDIGSEDAERNALRAEIAATSIIAGQVKEQSAKIRDDLDRFDALVRRMRRDQTCR